MASHHSLPTDMVIGVHRKHSRYTMPTRGNYPNHVYGIDRPQLTCAIHRAQGTASTAPYAVGTHSDAGLIDSRVDNRESIDKNTLGKRLRTLGVGIWGGSDAKPLRYN